MPVDAGPYGQGSMAPRELAYLVVEVYWPFIAKNVRFGRIVPHLPFMRKVSAKIMRAEGGGTTSESAAETFLNHLKESDELGKYQMFKEALRKCGYQLIVGALEDTEAITSEHDEHAKLLTECFQSRLMEQLNPTGIVQDLYAKEIITQDDVEEITKMQGTSSTSDVVFRLLTLIPRKSPRWYEQFLEILVKYDYKDLVNTIDPKMYAKICEPEDGQFELPFPTPSDTDSNSELNLAAANEKEIDRSASEIGRKLAALGDTVSDEYSLMPDISPPHGSNELSLSDVLHEVRRLAENQNELMRKMTTIDNKLDKLLALKSMEHAESSN